MAKQDLYIPATIAFWQVEDQSDCVMQSVADTIVRTVSIISNLSFNDDHDSLHELIVDSNVVVVGAIR